MQFKFDERRAAQAAAVLLKLAGGRLNYTKLIKLLYLADREAFLETGKPITGSRLVNMANGPVLSNVYDRIKGREPKGWRPVWSEYIATVGYDVELRGDPGDSALSDYHVEVLTELHRKYASYSYSRMIDVVHNLAEWKDPGNSALPLDPEDILRAEGRTDEAVEEYREHSAYLAAVDELFSTSGRSSRCG